MIKVSIVIPVYNMEEYLAQCLDSILSQTLEELEAVCVNDGSVDDSLKILSDYAARDSRVVVISQENKGVSTARNVAIDHARGEYIAFVDPDDYYPDDGVLSDLYQAAQEHNVKACGGSFSEDIDGRLKTYFRPEFSDYVFKRDGLMKYEDYQFDFGYQRFIFSAEMIKENEIYFPPFIRFQDPPFFVKAMICAEEFYALKRLTYCYRWGHQRLKWNTRRTSHMVQAITQNIEISRQCRLAKLHKLSVDRIEGIADAIVDNIYESNLSVLELVQTANELIDVKLIKEYDASFPEDYALSSLRRVIPAKTGRIDNALRKIQDTKGDLRVQYEQLVEKTNALRNEDRKLDKEIKEMQEQITQTEKKQAQSAREIEDIKKSKAFGVGRGVTFLPRKVRSFFAYPFTKARKNEKRTAAKK